MVQYMSWMKCARLITAMSFTISFGKSYSVNETGYFEMTAMPIRNNIGFDTFQEVLLKRDRNRLLSCPEMVGPIDGKYYCNSKDHGFCDRRSGTCFCNKGYTGSSCNTCDPYHFLEGGLCIEKKSCPSDCSSSGKCDVKTGRCHCNAGREGDDCSRILCKVFHKYCRYCDEFRCLDCFEGYTPVPDFPIGEQCVSCHGRYDPRCSSCNENACTECQDLLLLSIHRSGPRIYDPALPWDEIHREFGVNTQFGSQQPNAFDEAEHYFLVPSDLIPLKSHAVSCDQGISGDATFDCAYINISNVVCGNFGTFSLTRSYYNVIEGNGYVRVQIKRSGGGMGQVNISYAIEHITTDDSDVSATAYYTDSQIITFENHEVQKSFLVTIHDDVIRESNESFAIYLHEATYPARVGLQDRAVVNIIDDDLDYLQVSNFEVKKTDSTISIYIANPQEDDKDGRLMCVYFWIRDQREALQSRKGAFNRDSNGGLTWSVNYSDAFINGTVILHHLQPGGLMGHYFDTELGFSVASSITSRVDRSVNFTCFESGITHVRWEGFLVSSRPELKIFSVVARKSRLWIDGFLIIDEWISIGDDNNLASGKIRLNADEFYSMTLEVEVKSRDRVKLLWGSSTTSMKVIDTQSLHFQSSLNSADI